MTKTKGIQRLQPISWLWLLIVSVPFLRTSQARAHFATSRTFWGRYRGGSSSLSESPIPTISATQEAVDASNYNITTTSSKNDTTAIQQQQPPIPEWKQNLPPPLCDKKARTFQRISIPYQNQVAEIYLLGTAHVSNDSSRDVKLLLQSLQPDAIFVELCTQRTSLMEDPPDCLVHHNNETNNNNATATTKMSFWEKVEQVQQQNNNTKMQSIANVLLSQTQEEYAESLGVELGGEFRAAYQYWRSFPPTSNEGQSPSRPHLILGDRPLAITLARCWESLRLFGKIKVLIGLIISSFLKPSPEELRAWIQKIMEDETDLLTSSLEDLRKHFPTLERVIIRERDAYMACKLYQLCRGLLVAAASTSQRYGYTSESNDGHTVRNDLQAPSAVASNQKPIVIAALVGAGHVPGICEWLTTKTHPQGPEALLATLIETKKFQHEDLSFLVYDVTELQDIPPES